MGLIKCSECGKEISDRAEKCVNCGCPLSEIENFNNKNDYIKNISASKGKPKFYVTSIIAYIFSLIGIFILPIVFNTIGLILSIIVLLNNPKEKKEWIKPIWKYENKAKGFGLSSLILSILALVLMIVNVACFDKSVGFKKIPSEDSYKDVVSLHMSDVHDCGCSFESVEIDDNNYAIVKITFDAELDEVDWGMGSIELSNELEINNDFEIIKCSLCGDTVKTFRDEDSLYSENNNENESTYSTEAFSSNDISDSNNNSDSTNASSNDLTNNNNSYNEDDNNNYSSNYVDFEDNTSTDNTSDDNTPITSKNEEIKYEIGNKISFGTDLDHETNWTIVDVKNNKALIIYSFYSTQVEDYSNYIWENCDLRKYLNGSYYDSFKNSRKSRILETNVINSDNPEYDTAGGNDTFDKIFVLSVDEATKYSQYITEMLSYDDLWLRTPGKSEYKTMYCYDYPFGEFKINYEGEDSSYHKNALIGCWISIN